jgi:LAO/AO transport system kinase
MTIHIDWDKIVNYEKNEISKALNTLESSKKDLLEDKDDILNQAYIRAKEPRHVIGITGAPGVGKSTLISKLLIYFRKRTKSVGIIAVDPASKRYGGSFLGDRTRISHGSADRLCFIRSISSPKTGGLSPIAINFISLFEAIYDIIIIETLGVGQSEQDIENVVDTVLCILQPNAGDIIQFMKAGFLEIPHILVVNKVDDSNKGIKVRNELRQIVDIKENGDLWNIPIVLVSAKNNRGIDALGKWIESHFQQYKNDDLKQIRNLKKNECLVQAFYSKYGEFGVEIIGGYETLIKYLKSVNTLLPNDKIKMMDSLFIKKAKEIIL